MFARLARLAGLAHPARVQCPFANFANVRKLRMGHARRRGGPSGGRRKINN